MHIDTGPASTAVASSSTSVPSSQANSAPSALPTATNATQSPASAQTGNTDHTSASSPLTTTLVKPVSLAQTAHERAPSSGTLETTPPTDFASVAAARVSGRDTTSRVPVTNTLASHRADQLNNHQDSPTNAKLTYQQSPNTNNSPATLNLDLPQGDMMEVEQEFGIAQSSTPMANSPTGGQVPPLALPLEDASGAHGLRPVPLPPVVLVTSSDTNAWP